MHNKAFTNKGTLDHLEVTEWGVTREHKWPSFGNATILDVVCWATALKECQYGQMVSHLHAFVQWFDRASIVLLFHSLFPKHAETLRLCAEEDSLPECWRGILLSCCTEFSPKTHFVVIGGVMMLSYNAESDHLE